MPRRTSSPETDPALTGAGPSAAEIEDLEKQDFWQRHGKLSEDEKKVSMIYVYRLDPPIAKDGEDNNIDRIPSHLFDKDLLISKHGGGKFQFYHNSKLEGPKFNFKRVVTIAGIPARIYPNHILVDERNQPLPTAAPAAAPGAATPEGPPTKENIRDVIRETVAATKTGNDASQEALKNAVSLVTAGASEALKIVSNAKGKEDSSGLEALRVEVQSLRTELQDRQKQQLQEQIAELKEKIEAPPAKRGELGAAAETATALGIEGGAIGLVKAVLSGGGPKEDTVWEYGGRKIADAIGSFIADNGPSVMAWLRERTHVQHLEVLTRRQQAGMGEVTPPPAAPAPVHRPAPHPAPQTLPPQEAQPQGEPGPTGEEVIEMLKQQIPATIRYYWDRDFSGEATAIVVKGNFKPWLPFIRMQFKDLDKLIELAKSDPQLAPITQDLDFPAWAKEFFEEFHRPESDEAAPAAG